MNATAPGGKPRAQPGKPGRSGKSGKSGSPSGPMAYLASHHEQFKQGAWALVVLGALLSVLAWTRPATVAAQVSASIDKSMDFSYSATIPSTPAYQGTEITSPNPVFRKLANIVDVTYVYRGPPGTITPQVVLSTTGGWRWTVPMGTPVDTGAASAGDGYTGTIALDLNALEAQAKAGTQAAGLPLSDVTITVDPKVTLPAGDFVPELPLTLTKDTLSPVGGADAKFQVTDATTVQNTVMKPNSVKLLVVSIGIRPLRMISALMLLVGLVGLAVLRRFGPSGPVAPAARHGDLIVPVSAVSAPAGVVIDVDDVDELVKIAKRYALLVLHWTDPNVDVYFVQDERTMYRCVVPKATAAAGGSGGGTAPSGRPVPMPPPAPPAPMPPPANPGNNAANGPGIPPGTGSADSQS